MVTFLHRKFQFHVNSFAFAHQVNQISDKQHNSVNRFCVCISLSLYISQVQLTVLDVNDFRPRFSERVFTTSVFENEPVGTSVITLTATDLDEGENALLTYSLQGPGAGITHHT